MSPERQKAIVAHVADQLGSFRMWRTTILSAVGLVLCGVVAVILVGVLVSGAEGADDVGLPAGFAAVLGLVCLGGLAYGISGLRDLRKDPLLVALGSATPAITKVERLVDAWGVSVRFHLPSGAQYRIYFDAATADEVGRWLDRPA
jgi:hypothetical protein